MNRKFGAAQEGMRARQSTLNLLASLVAFVALGLAVGFALASRPPCPDLMFPQCRILSIDSRSTRADGLQETPAVPRTVRVSGISDSRGCPDEYVLWLAIQDQLGWIYPQHGPLTANGSWMVETVTVGRAGPQDAGGWFTICTLAVEERIAADIRVHSLLESPLQELPEGAILCDTILVRRE